MAKKTFFEVDGDLLVFHNKDRGGDQEVIISQDGGLILNHQVIEVDPADQALLGRFFEESANLEKKIQDIGPTATRTTHRESALSRAAVRTAILSLSRDDADRSEILADLNRTNEHWDREGDMAPGEPSPEEFGEWEDRWRDLAAQIQEQIPELAQLDWFLED